MFSFSGSPTPVRDDIPQSFRSVWETVSEPGPVLTAHQRNAVLTAARRTTDEQPANIGVPRTLCDLGRALYSTPGAVDGDLVHAASEDADHPATVEVIGLVAMLAAVDGFHHAFGVDLAPLPEPRAGDPTGRIAEGLTPRRTHVPMPQGAIPVALDLLPDVGVTYRSLFGPLYMTDAEMASPTFSREPGLNRAQLEVVSSRTSLLNECFY